MIQLKLMINIRILLFMFIPLGYGQLLAQNQYIEFGVGLKSDKFNIKQPEPVFDLNIDLGAMAFLSYGRIINKKWDWEAGIATNNYKVNFNLFVKEGDFYFTRELVSVMRSNRLSLNIKHKTKTLNSKLFWTNTFGISVLIGAQNPYDVILDRHKEVKTATSTESIDLKIKTFGLTGSAILINAGSKLYYTLNPNLKLAANFELISGMSEVTKVEIDYVIGSSTAYKKAVIHSNGFSTLFNIGTIYSWDK